MGGAGEQHLRLARAHRHGDTDGATAHRGRRARRHGLLESVQQGRRSRGRLLELRQLDHGRPVDAGIPARRLHHRRLRVGGQSGRGDQRPRKGCPPCDVAGRSRVRRARLLLHSRRDAGRRRPRRTGQVRNADRRRHRQDIGFGRRHPPAGDGGARHLRVRTGDHDHRRASHLGDVARRTLPRLATVEPDLAEVSHPAEGHGAVCRSRRTDTGGHLALADGVVHSVRCRDTASRRDVRLDGGALPDQAQVPAGERQVQPRRVGDPGPGGRRGVAGVRTRAVPGLEFQAGVGVRHRDGRDRRDLSRLPAGHPRQARMSMPDMHSIDAELEAEAATDVAAGDVAKG